MRKASLPWSGSVTVNEFLFVMLQIVLMTDQEPEILLACPANCHTASRFLASNVRDERGQVAIYYCLSPKPSLSQHSSHNPVKYSGPYGGSYSSF
jgi:hypothetical protein